MRKTHFSGDRNREGRGIMKVKRNISLMLVLCMVLSMVLGISVPSVAHAETNEWTTISKVQLSNIPVAKIGEPVTQADANLGITGEQDANYKVAAYWIDNATGKMLTNGDTFQDKNSYKLCIEVKALDDYGFSENAILMLDEILYDHYSDEDDKHNYHYVSDEESGRIHTLYVDIRHSFCDVIETVELSLVEPKLGMEVKDAVLSVTAPDNAKYELDMETNPYYWYDMATQKKLEPTAKFEKGHVYALQYWLIPEASYEFGENTTVTVNGKESHTSGAGEIISGYVDYAFTEIIDKIEVMNVPTAEIGGKATVSDIKVPENAKYEIMEGNAHWMDRTDINNEITLPEGAVFENGHKYELIIHITAIAGYEFAEDTVVTVNGVEVEDNYYVDATYAGIFQQYAFLEQIDKIEIMNVPKAEIGGKATYEGIKAPENANYEIADVFWSNWTTEEELKEGAIFEKGNKYSFSVHIVPKAGYEFSDDVVIMVNGKEEYKNAYADENWANVTYEYSFLTQLDKIEILDELPNAVAGQKAERVELKVPEGAKYSAYAQWYIWKDGMVEYFGGTFESGKAYIMDVCVQPEKGYGFSEDVAVTVAGKPVGTVFRTNYEIDYIISEIHDLGDNTIDTIEITVPEPKTGTEIPNEGIKVLEDAKYELVEAVWRDAVTGKEVKGEKFEKGKKYELFLFVEPKDNLLFANDLKIMLNGKEVAIADLSDDSSFRPMFVACGVVFDFTATTIAPDTGDTADFVLWIAVAAISVGSIAVVVNSKKRYNA